MMKKTALIALAGMMTFSLSGCLSLKIAKRDALPGAHSHPYNPGTIS
ncbi:MAG TPA: hypothetical protein VHY22_15560 [Chthoniobacteraceae bacterium]|jgi:hypothetical protein|nr:hypothetical protein [Chthoniobacteraceae bacterium]